MGTAFQRHSGRAKGANPESMHTIIATELRGANRNRLWLWIPGSPLRGAPE